jgi:EpsI family protein
MSAHQTLPISRSGTIFAVVILLIAFFVFHRVEDLLLSQPKIDIDITTLPEELGSWKSGVDFTIDARAALVLKLDHYVKRSYHKGDKEKVFLYIGYWKKQSGDNQAGKHSPVLCLPANGWTISTPEKTTWPLEKTPDITTSTLNAEFQNYNTFISYWFFQGTDLFTNETEALIRTNLGLLLGHRADGGIVEITVPLDNTKDRATAITEAKATTENFLVDFVPEFNKLLSSTHL